MIRPPRTGATARSDCQDPYRSILTKAAPPRWSLTVLQASADRAAGLSSLAQVQGHNRAWITPLAHDSARRGAVCPEVSLSPGPSFGPLRSGGTLHAPSAS